MPQPQPALLQASVNGGSPQTGGLIVPASATVQLIPQSTVGWNVPATTYQITAFPPGWPAPTGWTYDAVNILYFYVAGGAYGTNPPPITMPSSAQITAGIWGKWKFKLLVNGGGGVLTDTSLALRIDSDTGMQDVANSEGSEYGGALKWLAALQADLRLISAAIAGGVGGGVSLGSGTPSQVSAGAPSAPSLVTAAPFDHGHQVVVGTPVAIGTSLAGGTSNSLVRADHVHSLPWATITSVFGAATTSLSMNGEKITNLGAPSPNSTDAATTAYVDAAIAALPGSNVAGNGLQTSGFTWSVKPDPDGSIVVTAAGVAVGVLASDSQHGSRGGGTLHAAANGSAAGFMPAAMWSQLNAATAAPTASTLALRGGSGEGVFGWLATAASNVAGAGALRLPAGNQNAVALKGASHPTVQLLGTSGGGTTLQLGDGTEITSIDMQGAALGNVSSLSVGGIGSGSPAQIRQARTSTIDATPTTIFTIPIPAGDSSFAEKLVVKATLAPAGTNPNIAPAWFRRIMMVWDNPVGNQFIVGTDPMGSLGPIYGGSQSFSPFIDGGTCWNGTPDYTLALPGCVYLALSGGNVEVIVEGFPTPPAWQAAHPYQLKINVSTVGPSGGLIQVTTSVPHGLATGAAITITEVGGTQEANGTGTVTVTGASTFTLDGSTFTNAYTSGGLVLIPNAFVSNGGNIYLLTEPGTSAGSGGPTGTGLSITDGGAKWIYIGPVAGGIPISWSMTLLLLN